LQQYTLLTNRHIRENNQYDLVYAKTFPILQSSGTGKTKLVVQLSAFQAGLLVCTRRPKSQWTISTSFPPSDNSVYSFLQQYTLLTNRHIRENNQYDLVYAKTFPILQSSG
ncbi:hypothetical protein, partial [Enterobacter cloacae]|uniref:hypothetical protein n=1 Tax=Enterobacter cloacae TaxID=550 RepID=UPI000BE7235E